MANIIKRVWNQNRMVQIEDLKGMTFQAEQAGHTFQISGIDDDGNTVALTGTPAGVLLRPDNTDVALTCSVSGGVVSATLPANCYDVPGRFGLTIFITSGSSKTAIYAAVGTVTRTSSGTVAPGTSQSVVDLINAINAAINSIPASYSALLADIAPTYSDSALYSVGQYAWYDGDLKRCIVPITTAESYTAAHWTSAVLGQDVSDLKSALDESTDTKIFYFDDGHTIATNGAVGSTVDLVNKNTSSAMGCAVMDCQAGDEFTITGAGSSTPRLWCFVDSSNKITRKSGGSLTVVDLKLTAETGEAKLILNTKFDSTRGLCCKNTPIPERITDLQSQVTAQHEETYSMVADTRKAIDDSTSIEVVYFTDGYTIATDGEIGSSVDLENPNSSTEMGYAVVPCQEGNVFTISGTGSSTPRLWCFVDGENKIVRKSAGSLTVDNLVLTAESGETKLILNTNISTRGLCCKGTPLKNYIDDLYANEIKTDNSIKDALDRTAGAKMIYFIDGYTITTNGSVGSTVDVDSLNTSGIMGYAIVPCQEGDVFTITGAGAAAARLWCFVDSDNKIVRRSNGSITVTDLKLTAETGEAKLILNTKFDSTRGMCYKGSKNTIDILLQLLPQNIKNILATGFVKNIPEVQPMTGTNKIIDSDAYDQFDDIIALWDALLTVGNRYETYITKCWIDGSAYDDTEKIMSDEPTSGEHNPRGDMNQYPLIMYKFTPHIYGASITDKPKCKKVLIVAGQHGAGSDGDYLESPVAVYYFAKKLVEDFYDTDSIVNIRNNYEIDFIPVANPWGVNNKQRTNGQGIDINRDYHDFQTITAQEIKKLIDNDGYDFVLDSHCLGDTSLTTGPLHTSHFRFFTRDTKSTALGWQLTRYIGAKYNVPTTVGENSYYALSWYANSVGLPGATSEIPANTPLYYGDTTGEPHGEEVVKRCVDYIQNVIAVVGNFLKDYYA